MRKYYWYVTTFLKKHGVLVLSSIIAAVLIFSLSLPFVLRLLNVYERHYVGLVGSYTLTSLPPRIESLVSVGLTQVDENGNVKPNVAERWSAEDDGKTYRFVVKKKVTWQDGKMLEPSDVTYRLENVQVITTSNDVIFKLNEPFVPFPTIAARPLLRYSSQPYLFFFRRPTIIGLGEYQVTDYRENGKRLSEITLRRDNEHLVFRFYLTEQDAIAAFQRGEVDQLEELSDPKELSAWKNITVSPTLDEHRYLAVFFNTMQGPLALNAVRQALNYATPKPADNTRAFGPISPASWAYTTISKRYDQDDQRAIERLLDAVNELNAPIQFELTTTPFFANEAEDLQRRWQELGRQAFQRCQSEKAIKDKSRCENLNIGVSLRVSNFPDISNFQAILMGQLIPPDPDQYQLWHSSVETNFTHYKNTRIDSLLERGRKTDERSKRFEIYQDFQQFFSEDAPVIFLRYLTTYTVKR